MAVNGADIAKYAQQFLGTPYAWGGNSLTSGIDCSGLAQQVYKHFGLNIPRVTYDQITQGKSVEMNSLQAGDLVFFDTNRQKSGPDHVGIYIGNGKFIEAPKPGEGVRISDMKSGYYYDSFMGGRRVSGITGGGPSGDWNPGQDPQAKISPEELASEYGFSYAFLNSIPELKTLFGEFVNNDLTQPAFNAKLKNTEWWKTNSDSMRKAAALKFTDPATYNANVGAAKVQVEQLAAEMGAIIPPNKLGSIAEKVVSTNLDENGLRAVLGNYVTFTKGTLVGEAGQYSHAIKQYAYSQGVTLSDQTIKNQAALIGRRLATADDFKAQIADQAASTYPAYADQIKGGQTMMDIASPYIQIMGKELDLNPNTIGVQDPLVRRALNGVDANGKPAGLDQTDFLQLVRNDPRWVNTQGAQDSVMNVGLKVLKDMGLR